MEELQTQQKSLASLTSAQLADAVKAMGQPAFRAKQLFTWMHRDLCTDFVQMTNLPAALRRQLAAEWTLDAPTVVRRQASSQDGTVKLLLGLADGNQVETVLMRYQHGYSVCVSCQVGCRMGCAFCASTRGGMVRSLTAGEMAAQLAAAIREAGERVGHLVLMGIGEPLDNFDNVMDFLSIITDKDGQGMSQRSISLSTCGLVPQMYQLAKRDLSLTLSVSLHATTDALRDRLMPVNRRWPIDQLMAACRDYRAATGRRVSFEYAMLRDVNDSAGDCQRLVKLLARTDAHVNLIPANSVDETDFRPSPPQRVEAFRAGLEKAGVPATVRRRLGADIDAACGQLRMRQMDKQL